MNLMVFIWYNKHGSFLSIIGQTYVTHTNGDSYLGMEGVVLPPSQKEFNSSIVSCFSTLSSTNYK